MFVLLPVFAVLLKIVYLGRAPQPSGDGRGFTREHLVFAAHNHAFCSSSLRSPMLVVPWPRAGA